MFIIDSNQKSLSPSPTTPTTPMSSLPNICGEVSNMKNQIIGSGNYSVVLRPEIQEVSKIYLEYSDKDESDIVKVFKSGNKDVFAKELTFLLKIKNIPCYTSFTVPIKGASKFDIAELKYFDTNLLSKLDVLSHNHDKELYQIIFGYGGIELTKITYNIKFMNFLMYVRGLLLGIQKLQEENIVHRDIKPSNVLITEYQMNLIDYGLACDVKECYGNDDADFVLSYMYMYHPPEFYIAHLLHESMKTNEDFSACLDITFQNMTTYSQELKIYYEEHYYRYHNLEVYNIFSYRQAFKEFYEQIKNKSINSFQELFTDEMAFKADVYSVSYILKTLKKHIIFDNVFQRQIFNTLYEMMFELNPFKRASVSELLIYIESVYV